MRLMIFTVPVFFVFCACDVLVPATGQEHQPCFGDGICLGELQCSKPDNTCIGIEEDCENAVCSPSSAGFDCGTSCSGATESCVFGQCVNWQNPAADPQMQWQEAIDYCENLTLDGHDDWHLPTISELRSLIRGCPATETGGSCGVTDSCLSSTCSNSGCDGCSSGGGPAGGCYWLDGMEDPCEYYWSSSFFEGSHDDAGGAIEVSNPWLVNFDSGYVVKGNNGSVRCVR